MLLGKSHSQQPNDIEFIRNAIAMAVENETRLYDNYGKTSTDMYR